jgi:hypothetical protein
MLFTVEFLFVVRYFPKFNVDGPRRFHCVVSLRVVNALVALMATCARSWKLLIIHRTPAGPPPVQHQSWPLPLMIICNTIAATIEQCYLLYRYYGLSKCISFTVFVVLLIITRGAFGFMWAIGFLGNTRYDMEIVTTAAYCFSASIDIFIPMLLIWELRKIKTTSACTQSFIRRVIVNASSAGCVVALCEILILILLWTVSSAICLLNAALGPLYGITVLVNLFVCQRRLPRPTLSQTKTGNITTSVGFDAFQSQQLSNLPHLYERGKPPFNSLSDIESKSSKEISSTDYATGTNE